MQTVFSVPVVLKRMKRRTLAVHVFSDRVEVRAPNRLASQTIERFVGQRSAWIGRKLSEVQHRHTQAFTPLDQQLVSVMGKVYTLRWQQSAVQRVWIEGDFLMIASPSLDAPEASRLFSQWLLKEARRCLVARTESLAVALGVREQLSGVCFRYTRSIWGRCSAQGEILLNPSILMAPEPVIHYLLVHEVCHLRHMNHSAAFWALVGSVCPAWAEARRWLKQHGHTLHSGL